MFSPVFVLESMNKLRGGGVPTSVSDLYILRLCIYLLQLIISLNAPPVSAAFMDRTIDLLPPTSTPSLSFVVVTHLSLYINSPHPLPEFYVAHLEFAHICHPSDSAARLCTPLHVTVSTAVYCIRSPPFSDLRLHPGICSPMGVT